MTRETLYFTDNFFSAGKTTIFNELKKEVGVLDLKSAFTSGVSVLDTDGNAVISGKFPLMGSRWRIYDNQGTEIGNLRNKFSLLSKKYEYNAYGRGIFLIKSEAFSKQYQLVKEGTEEVVAEFNRITGFFSSPAYQLIKFDDVLFMEELIVVVMGVNAIEKSINSAASSS
ncbi:hypothetical protein [Niallia sp. 01092]|uniref:hypothetical protein n=1 Tax=unclassified Niallia TaxID=2837522 RepID=UPI003FD39998